MGLKIIKNTVLFLVLVMLSCSSKTKTELGQQIEIDPTSTKQNIVVNKPIVGANQLGKYLRLLHNKNVGIVANQTSVIFKNAKDSIFEVYPSGEIEFSHIETNSVLYTHLVDSLLKHNIKIKSVFSPEHGFRGKADAGELVKDGIDTQTGLPILSLHGKNKKPTKEQLKDIDILIFDIQDVGVRFYTYISTLHYIMEACAEQNIPLLILDRPNPNGSYVDGPVLEEKHRSFLGMHPIPLVHGMTIGEYANMINGEGWLYDGIQCDITVVETINYTHNSFYSLPIRPSPNLPNDQAITLYPSLGLFEGTNINAGRGTEYQFQRYGAPFLDKTYYMFSFVPEPNFGSKYPKHKGETCYGVDLSQINAQRQFTLRYVIDAYTNAADKSKVFNTDNFTTHAGTAKLQEQIESGLSEMEIRATWQEALNAYKETRKKYLIYD